MVALIIPIYERIDYLRDCFKSLQDLTTKPDIIVLVDDHSKDKNIATICRQMKGATYMRHTSNKGVRGALKTGITEAIKQGASLIINLDSDAIVNADFLERLVALKKEHPKHIISGFNAVTERNPVLVEYGDFVMKKHCNGINMCFDVHQYKFYIEPALEMQGNWDYNVSLSFERDKKCFIVTKPSCVQHIGMISSMGHSGNGIIPDTAQDFKGLHLPDVTLFGIDAHDPQGISAASEICQRFVKFGAVKIITQRMFPGATASEGRTNYSKFIIKQLDTFFHTSHVLIIHADGYILNWKAWDNNWLQYDYIGATWNYKDNKNVGNGGFSLRSKRLQHILATDPKITDFHPEDDKICRQYRSYLEDAYGIRFAPEEVANVFSIEAYGCNVFPNGNRYSGQFGFHGHHVDFAGAALYGVPQDIIFKKSRR